MKFLVTAGPTREHIDDIRFLSNGSSGRMGFAVATAAREAGHEAVLVAGPTPIEPPSGPELHRVVSAEEMRAAVLAEFEGCDALVMTAAVADYRPESRIEGKRKKAGGRWDLRLVRTPDILAEVGERNAAATPKKVLVGFALETSDGEANARAKLERKGLDLIVLDSPQAVGADVSDFTVLGRDGRLDRYMSVSKEFLALRLVSLVAEARLEP